MTRRRSPALQRGLAAWAAAALLASCGSPEPMDLLVVSFDTTRADHTSVYGYERDTTPALAALAASATVFERAYAQSVHTSPSHLTMLTGLRPTRHGVLFNGDRLPNGGRGAATLAGRLDHAGYRTAAFVSGAPLRPELSDVRVGFEDYDARFKGRRRRGEKTVDRALGWLADRPDARPVFLFVHLYDAHGPYKPTERWADHFRSPEPGAELERIPKYQQIHDRDGRLVHDFHEYRDAYDGAIRYQDEQLERLLAAFDLDRTVVAVLADHGETLDERYHKLNHAAQLFEEQVRIPLVVRAPGGPPQRIEALVETTDLVPTLLDLLRVDPGRAPGVPMDGRSFAAIVRGAGGRDAPLRSATVSIAESSSEHHSDRGYELDRSKPLAAIREGRWKLIRYPGRERLHFELYDLETDPGEKRIRADEAERIENLSARLAAEMGEPKPRHREALTPELAEQLRELGYGD